MHISIRRDEVIFPVRNGMYNPCYCGRISDVSGLVGKSSHTEEQHQLETYCNIAP